MFRIDNIKAHCFRAPLLFVLQVFMLATLSWSVHASTALTLNVVEGQEYGYGYNGNFANRESADFTFDGEATDLILSLTSFDIDSKGEVEILINGQSLDHLSITNNNGFIEDQFTIPVSYQIAGVNTLRFKQFVPGWRWGITDIGLTVAEVVSTQLVVESTDTSAYGFLFKGIKTNRNNALFEFQHTGDALSLKFDAFDIDTPSELNILVNGQSVGFALLSGNNAIGSNNLTLPEGVLSSGTNTLEFVQKIPGWKWGIENLLLTSEREIAELVIGITESDDYGFAFNGQYDHQDFAEFIFTGSGTPLTLSLDTFDIDTRSEISVILNGSTIGKLSKTGNNAFGEYSVELPVVAEGSNNSLVFQQSTPGWKWGITNILLDEVNEPHLTHDNTHAQAYGFAYAGAITKQTSANFTFDRAANGLLLSLDTYDIDASDEVSVLVNGSLLGYLSVTADNANGTTTLQIPSSAQKAGVNELSFVQKVPGYRWGISNITLATQAPAQPALSEYELVFNDEFNGFSLDGNKWNTGLIWGPYLPINNEQQLYVDTLGINQGADHSPFDFTGETMIIRATPVGNGVQPPPRPNENDPIWNDYNEYRFNGPNGTNPGYRPQDVDYLSGIITSYDSFKMTHGYVETRAKLPAGQGLWPAFWLLNTHYVEDAPEIDIMEFLGHEPEKLYHTYHYFDTQNNWERISTPSYEYFSDDWTQDFHTFGLAWSPNEIIWYVDGVEARKITDADYKISSQAMYLLANLAVGGNWPGDADASTPFPAEYEIDYIRAYKKKLSPTLNIAQDYQLMFNDEFNGNSLDITKWNTSFLWGPYFAINNEQQYYVDSADTDANIGYTPFDVSNGTLTITAEPKENSPANVPPTSLPGPNEPIWSDNPAFQQGPYTGADYTSGMITSYDSFKFVNGYAEIRAKVPAGDGLWPAFWLLNAYYVGPQPEIDIMEILGENPGTAYHTFHRSNNVGVPLQDQYTSSHGTSATGYADDFHTFGVRWQPGTITWYVDGKIVDTYTQQPGDNRAYQLMYVIANLAVGGNFNTQPLDPSALPAKFEIDYIRVYQENDLD